MMPTPGRIAKGRLGQPVGFGYKAQVVDNAEGVVHDHRVVTANPPDAPMVLLVGTDAGPDSELPAGR